MYQNPHLFDDVAKGWALWVLANCGYSGKIGKGFGYGVKENKSELKVHNKRLTFDTSFKERLNLVQIECNDALKVIKSRDRVDSFFYIDPPYVGTNCGHYAGYTEHDYEMLLQTLSELKGKFLLSSFPTKLLDKYTNQHGWKQIEFEKNKSASRYRSRKIEVLTANYEI